MQKLSDTEFIEKLEAVRKIILDTQKRPQPYHEGEVGKLGTFLTNQIASYRKGGGNPERRKLLEEYLCVNKVDYVDAVLAKQLEEDKTITDSQTGYASSPSVVLDSTTAIMSQPTEVPTTVRAEEAVAPKEKDEVKEQYLERTGIIISKVYSKCQTPLIDLEEFRVLNLDLLAAVGIVTIEDLSFTTLSRYLSILAQSGNNKMVKQTLIEAMVLYINLEGKYSR